MAEERGRATNGRRTKTLSWYASDQAVLRALRAAVAAKSGLLLTERDVVAAALRLALRGPSDLGLTRPVAW